MAGNTYRFLLSLTIPSIFGFLSILWFLRKKNSGSRQHIGDIQIIDHNLTDIESQDKFLYPMKLKNHTVNSGSETIPTEMQLKEAETALGEQSVNSNGVVQLPKVKGKGIHKSKSCENGTTCLPKQASVNGCKKDSTSPTIGDNIGELTNGMKLASLGEVSAECSTPVMKQACVEVEIRNGSIVVLNGKENGMKNDLQANPQHFLLDETAKPCVTVNGCNEKESYQEITKHKTTKVLCDSNFHQLMHSHNFSGGESDISILSSSVESVKSVDANELSVKLTDSGMKDSNEHIQSTLGVEEIIQRIASTEVTDTKLTSTELADAEHMNLPLAHVEINTTKRFTSLLDYAVIDSNEVLTLPVDYIMPDSDGHLAPPVDFVVADSDELLTLPVEYAMVEVQAEMLESPGATYCDSLGSNDSGRGPSEGPSEIQIASEPQLFYMVYEFEILPEDCGLLIGRNGKHVKFLNKQTNAQIVIRKHPFCSEKKICAVHGTESEINDALKLIRKRFPVEHYPDVTLAQINNLPVALQCPETLKLSLPEGAPFEALLCATVSAGHFFLQQPTHSTFYQLFPLTSAMTSLYSQVDSPMIENISKGNICAAALASGWYRAEVIEVFDTDECRLKFLDYGGYAVVPKTSIRQIKCDFMQLPFQATECYLAGAVAIDESGWSAEATALFEEIAQGQIIYGYISGYSEDRIPYVNLYKVIGVENSFINQELISAGLARPMSAE